jgi:hypothetical protein
VNVKEKIVKYRKGFLEKSCKDLLTTKIKKLGYQRKTRQTQTILDRKKKTVGCNGMDTLYARRKHGRSE